MQKLSKRLQAVADFVTPGWRVADVGTDHGHLPIFLVQSGRCPCAVAMDVRTGPLARAREHIAAAGLEQCIQTRLSDGLHGLLPNEADSIVIAGMGGWTVIHILEEAAHVLPGIKELVLEPQSDIAKVRRFLRTHGLYADREELVYEDGKFYPILHVAKAENMRESLEGYINGESAHENIPEYLKSHLRDNARFLRVLDQYGSCLVRERHPMLKKLLEQDMERNTGIWKALEHGGGAGKHAARRKEVERELEELRLLYEACYGQDCAVLGSIWDKESNGVFERSERNGKT